MAFTTQVRTTPPLAVVRLHGDLDLETAHEVVAAVARVLEQGCTVVAVDLSDVQFLDCSALGTLIAARNRLDAVRGELVFSAASRPVLRLLELTGTSWLLGAGVRAPTLVR